MKTLLAHLLASRWFVMVVHCALWGLLYLTVANLSGTAPRFRDGRATSPPRSSLLPADAIGGCFSTPLPVPVDTNATNPFHTIHFQPRQAPAPPPPTTRKIELTYLGYYQTDTGLRQAIVQFEGAFLVSSVGSKITANLFAADDRMQSLVVTNPAAQTTSLLKEVFGRR